MASDSSAKPGYLIIVPWPLEAIGGVTRVVISLARSLEQFSSYLPLIGIQSWQSTPQPATEDLRVMGVRLRSVAPDSGNDISIGALCTLPIDALQLLGTLRANRIAVVNVHYPDLGALVPLLLRSLRAYRGKVILSVHGSDMECAHASAGLARRLWKLLLSNSDGVVAPSDSLASAVKALAPDAKVTTIHNGADVDLFRRSPRRKDGRCAILNIGHFHPRKGQDVLLLAFRGLLEQFPQATLRLIGAEGPSIDSTRNLVQELGLQDAVSIHVDVPHEQLPEYMEQADLFVLPSRIEPFGIVLLEAGAAGLPVVACAAGGIPELIQDEVTGLLVPIDDIPALQAAMAKLLTDHHLAGQLAHAWQQKVLSHWSWERTCHEYIRIVRSEDR